MSSPETGPGPLSAAHVGQLTVAKSFELTPRRIMAYAAGIKDPNPQFFDDLRQDGLIGHPFMACSFQWNVRFMPQLPLNTRADPYRVHAWTDLRMSRPFRQGDVITTQGQVVLVSAIKPGVHQLTRFTMTDASGAVVGELDYAGITRGATLLGDPRSIGDIHSVPTASWPAEPIWQEPVYIAADAAQIYTECADIYNPIHTERSVAKAAGLPDIILHGSATQAISASQVIKRAFGGDAAALRRYAGQLRAMVLLDSTITVRCFAQRTDADGRSEVFFDVINASGQQAITGGYAGSF